MIFNSFIFIFIFFPIVFIGFWLFSNRQYRYIWLTVTGYVFYGYWNWKFLFLMLATTALDFFIAKKIGSLRQDPARARRYLVLGIVANLGALGFFKYANFFVQSAADVGKFLGFGGSVPLLHIVLPISISFYTFQAISYTIDVYRGRAEVITNFFEYSTYIALFAHLVAGPIVRYIHIAPDLKNVDKPPQAEFFFRGIYFFVIGLAKKLIIADSIASLINPIIQNYESFTATTAWLAALGYTYQMYFDFSGYSDMAVGLASFFGFRFPQNFNSPYKARTITDYWRRWHMSLSTWLHDYLFVPLVFRFSRNTKISEPRIYASMIITMFLAGLWHGASWTFVAWGTIHGALLVLDKMIQGIYQKVPAILQRVLTFFVITLTLTVFRSPNFTVASTWFKNLFDGQWLMTQNYTRLLLLIAIGTLITQFLPNTFELKYSPKLRYAGALAAAFVVSIVLINYKQQVFIYYQF